MTTFQWVGIETVTSTSACHPGFVKTMSYSSSWVPSSDSIPPSEALCKTRAIAPPLAIHNSKVPAIEFTCSVCMLRFMHDSGNSLPCRTKEEVTLVMSKVTLTASLSVISQLCIRASTPQVYMLSPALGTHSKTQTYCSLSQLMKSRWWTLARFFRWRR